MNEHPAARRVRWCCAASHAPTSAAANGRFVTPRDGKERAGARDGSEDLAF
ncbi:hypothetical protein NDU88_002743, partial [Pleurodeles waltl]